MDRTTFKPRHLPLCAVLLGTACVTVPPGHVALVTDVRGLDGPLGEGVHLIDPFASVDLLDLRRQERDDDLFAVTSDGAAIAARTSLVTYRLVPGELRALMREVGPDAYAVAIGPVVSAYTRRVLGQLRLEQLDTEHLRRAQAEITRGAAASLRPLHVVLESVDLRQVKPLSHAVQEGFEAAAVLEQRVRTEPTELHLADQRADELRVKAAGIAAAHTAVAPTLTPSSLEAARARAFQELLESKNVSVTTDGALSVEVSP